MFEKEIGKYEQLRQQYQREIVDKMDREGYSKYNLVLFSTHSCGIEGNSFSVDDTRELREKGLGLIPVGKSLFEVFEILDHFEAYSYIMDNTDQPIDEAMVKRTNYLLTRNTLSYHHPGSVAGEYTDTDMVAGDTLFGDHEKLIRQIPNLLKATEKAVQSDIHPMITAARFHGFFEYLHPFRDGNGRTGRLLSNQILMRMGHPQVIIPKEERSVYIEALRRIRTEGTDEYLVCFFFNTAIHRMESELSQKRENTLRSTSFHL